MCNSIMAVAHGVMLTCDLVYKRCYCTVHCENTAMRSKAIGKGSKPPVTEKGR